MPGQGWITVDSYRLPVIDNPGFLTTMSLNPPPNPPPPQPHTPGKSRPAARSIWRSYFHDHPMSTIDKTQAQTVTGRPKLYCKGCFVTHLNQLKTQDQERAAGNQANVRTENVLTARRQSGSTTLSTTSCSGTATSSTTATSTPTLSSRFSPATGRRT